ncbi:hypothetical protein DB347_22750 [Opitutaceae bacterium EW11]|nr:hypothetical protein DB347_22750 [Opitutaceae bacterium EW11]
MSTYSKILAIVAAFIVLPPALAHVLGAGIQVLAPCAAIQMIVSILLFITAPVSLCLMVGALVQRRWHRGIWAAFALSIPFAVWPLCALGNPHGWEAVMGI